MIDPILSLSFSIYSNKGVYALLLGSGISRAASIPTGWEIVIDLIIKLSAMIGEDCSPDPETWYRNKFGKEPDYSELINEIAKSPTERNQLLRSYFEPNEEELALKVKTPTKAHRSIANLVAKGYFKVIITTNFDRLIEKALEDAGVSPTVISSPEAIEGALPLSHIDQMNCLVIKVHGDYLDIRIKNTISEVSHYDPRMDAYLDRILDEFGVITCGWSAEWDLALKEAFQRCKNHRFTTYWCYKGRLGVNAKDLISLRRAELISIIDADSFFNDIEHKILSLHEFSKPHPLSAQLAINSLKRYMEEDKKISINDLIMNETEKTYNKLEKIFADSPKPSKDELTRKMKDYETSLEILLALIITGCMWSKGINPWVKCLDRIVNLVSSPNKPIYELWDKVGLYPALILLYGGGVAALLSKNGRLLSSLLTEVTRKTHEKEDPLYTFLNAPKVIDQYGKLIEGFENRRTPLSDYLYSFLREPLRDLIPSDIQYDKLFDKMEYMLALYYSYHRLKPGYQFWAPPGRFAWKYPSNASNEIDIEIEEQGEHFWPLYGRGMFNGTIEGVKTAKSKLDTFIDSLAWD